MLAVPAPDAWLPIALRRGLASNICSTSELGLAMRMEHSNSSSCVQVVRASPKARDQWVGCGVNIIEKVSQVDGLTNEWCDAQVDHKWKWIV